MQMLSDHTTTPKEAKLCMENLQWDGVDLGVINIDECSRQGAYGVEITERLFWEAFVMMQDCSRPPGSIHDIGRDSSPDYQDMNFKATRHDQCEPGDPLPVVWQVDPEFPMSPRTLVMAYEMDGRVLPVVSDFDCFLVGTRGVKFDQPLPPDQVELVNWTVSKIEGVLDSSAIGAEWVSCWLDVLKKEAIKGFYPKQPRFGYGDPKSYSLMECAVSRLQETGAVRHGAECFNYFFPQELDDEFLVICDTLPGGLPWKYVGVEELQKILIHKINDGHSFPLNPKWILCDPGWKKVYDALMASDRRNVQESLNVWFPPESGIREEIERVHAKHPRGFASIKGAEDSRDVMEFAKLELEKFVSREMGKRKIRAVIAMVSLANSLPSAKAKELLEIQTLGHSYRPPSPQSAARRLSRQVARARASMVAQQRSSQVATKEYSHTVRHHQRGCDHRDLNADSSGSDTDEDDDPRLGGDSIMDGPDDEFATITGAGLAETNGLYQRTKEICDGLPVYRMQGTWRGRACSYCLFRCRLSNGEKKWFISYVPQGVKPGTTKDVDFYSADPVAHYDFPPEHGWTSCSEGVDPSPTLRRHGRDMADEDLSASNMKRQGQ